jgi:hypothetical protein
MRQSPLAVLGMVSWLLLAPSTGASADQVSNQPQQKSTRPIVNVSRVSYDDRGYRGGNSHGMLGAVPLFEPSRGTVWFQNTSDEKLTKVGLTVHFYNYQSYRDAGSTKTYDVGTVDGRRSLAVDYEWLNSANERVYPWVEIRWVDGNGQPGRTVAQPFSY